MSGTRALLFLVALLLQSVSGRPDLSGHWSYVPDSPSADLDRSAPARPSGARMVKRHSPTFGSGIEIRQESDRLLIHFPRPPVGPAQEDLILRLDGQPTRGTTGPFVTVWTAAWEGPKLVVTMMIDDPKAVPTETLVRSLSLSPEGKLMVDTTAPASAVARDVYTRSRHP